MASTRVPSVPAQVPAAGHPAVEARLQARLGEIVLSLTRASSEEDVLLVVARGLPDLIPADRASAVLLDPKGGLPRVVALHGHEAALPAGTRLPLDRSRAGMAMRQRELLTWAPHPDEPWTDSQALAREGMRHVMNAPLVAGEDCLGCLNVATGADRVFTDSDRRTFETLAALTTASIERLRLLERTRADLDHHREHAGRLGILNDLGAQLSGALSEDEVFGIVADGVLELLPALRVSYVTVDAVRGQFLVQALVGMADPLGVGSHLDIKDSALASLLVRRRPVWVTDFEQSPYPEHARLHALGARAGGSLPVLVEGNVVGIVNLVVDDPELLDDEVRTVLEAFSHLTSSTMERVSAHAKLANQLEWQALHDPLTDLANRRAFDEHLEVALTLANRAESPVRSCLLLIDLDQFKLVNDTYGHVTGDRLLREVAVVLASRVGKQDLVARFGGDEFAVVLHDCGIEDGRKVAERLRIAVLELDFREGDRRVPVSMSVGLKEIGPETAGTSELLAVADTALYRSKRHGRNRVSVGNPDDVVVNQRLGDVCWSTRTRDALAHERFTLVAQVIEPLGVGESGLHFEALVRMLGEEGHLLPPAAFIPTAERLGLIPEIDLWVVRNVIDAIGRSPLPIASASVNLSIVSVESESFLERLTAVLDESGFRCEHLVFEITESVAISNVIRVTNFISALTERGCRFALDDFGAGFSSFRHLQLLPVDFIKIDGSLVRAMPDNPVSVAAVRAIQEMAQVTGKRSVAEFVETIELKERLRSMGIDFAQGYGIRRPIPIAELLELV